MNLLKTISIKRGLLAAIFILSLGSAAQASDWWNHDWTVRKQITIDTAATGAGITEPIGTAPVLVRLHAGNFRFDVGREDGSDLRFVAADNKTLLPFHIEKYDSLMGEAFIWVNIPDVKPGAKTSFWLYAGNGSSQMEKGGDAKATYDQDTVLVYHFTEHGAPAADSTGSGNQSENAITATDGSFIGSGIRLDDKIVVTVPPSPSLQWTEGTPVTISTWIKLTTLASEEVIFSRRDKNTSVVVGVDNGIPYVEVTKDGGVKRGAAVAPLSVGSWRHLAVVASPAGVTPATITLFLDGESVATLTAALPALNSALQIGGEKFTGELDEFEISRVARSVGLIKFAASSQGDKGTKVLSLGPDEEPTNWLSWLKSGYVGVIVQSLTFDGWVVIGILMVMSLISWWVMVSKASYLNNVAKGNSQFMKLWREISTELDILLHTDMEHVNSLGGRIDQKSFRSIRRSSLYRIYSIGAEEVRSRLSKDEQAGSSKALSVRSVQAIRATLDAGLVRETQKLNSLLVLLTIAISGGPFLGLLGTVVGVMITFAAIAQQGEVNVNAIAPGISAALAATVAGLAVAIPALFGYNYLLSRVKDATSDTHVFIDEFTTKMAECFGGENDEAAVAETMETH